MPIELRPFTVIVRLDFMAVTEVDARYAVDLLLEDTEEVVDGRMIYRILSAEPESPPTPSEPAIPVICDDQALLDVLDREVMASEGFDCPYCRATFSDVDLLLDHSTAEHGR